MRLFDPPVYLYEAQTANREIKVHSNGTFKGLGDYTHALIVL
jgi:hypothetical protein